MRRIIQARIYQGEKYFVAECFDLPVVTQGATLDEVAKNLREALELYFDGEDSSELGIDPEYSTLVNFELEDIYA